MIIAIFFFNFFPLSVTDQSMPCAKVWRQDYSLARISLSIRKGEISKDIFVMLCYALQPFHVCTLSYYSLFFSFVDGYSFCLVRSNWVHKILARASSCEQILYFILLPLNVYIVKFELFCTLKSLAWAIPSEHLRDFKYRFCTFKRSSLSIGKV